MTCAAPWCGNISAQQAQQTVSENIGLAIVVLLRMSIRNNAKLNTALPLVVPLPPPFHVLGQTSMTWIVPELNSQTRNKTLYSVGCR